MLADKTHQVSHYVTVDWTHNHTVATINLLDDNRHSIDLFVATLIKTLNRWDKHLPIRIIYDIQAVGFTPYLRAKAQPAVKQTPDRPGRAAFLLSPSPLHRAYQLSIRRQMFNKRYLHRQIFFEKQAALAWVSEDFTPYPSYSP